MHAAAFRLSLLSALALTSPVAAQQSAPDTINVIGRKPEDAHREALTFVRKLGVAERPVARWIEPICPHVFGVAPEIGRPGGWTIPGEVYLQYSSSIVSTQMVRVLKGATIIIDANRATGTSLDSVAAFASLVALAEVQPNEEAPAQSILSLFKAAGPTDLTSVDKSFLRTLYRLPLDRTALAQRGLLVKGLLASGSQSDE